MPQHYVYADPDPDNLNQGDILDRTDELTELLQQYHPHYGRHQDYKYFMVLTQSCDLHRRGTSAPRARYVTLAAVRPVEDVLRREAEKHQDDWQQVTSTVGSKAKAKLMLFMEKLIDNNEPGYFYLHEDQSLGLAGNNCAFLALSVALRVEHYPLCLESKIAGLKEPFQAKLGWLVGNMYSRVGTTEWNDQIPDRKISNVAKQQIDGAFATVDDKRISEGLKKLAQDKSRGKMTPAEILAFIKSVKIDPNTKQFIDRAENVLRGSDLADLVQGRVVNAIASDDDLRRSIEEILTKEDRSESAGLTDEVVEVLVNRVRSVLQRDTFPGYDKLCGKIVARIAQDTTISRLLNRS